MHPPFLYQHWRGGCVYLQPDCLFESASLSLDSQPEAMPATAGRPALDGAQKECYASVNPMGNLSLSLSPSPSAYPNQHSFCALSRVAAWLWTACVWHSDGAYVAGFMRLPRLSLHHLRAESYGTRKEAQPVCCHCLLPGRPGSPSIPRSAFS